ncbi:hypothetical protein B0T18DRAFT_448194 [Schizothecium vesticola]|uniref:Transmembrane protein n=1 Tax=Schizothecium vesticola TaxID=314040 RepID=A0AA40EQ89_9PEZI|nr:hypothetical protein B0T18DRAFT_448194 [Schizothecium vesticola]
MMKATPKQHRRGGSPPRHIQTLISALASLFLRALTAPSLISALAASRRQPTETPKVLLPKPPAHTTAAARAALQHLPALGATAVLLALNGLQVFWDTQGLSTSDVNLRLNALQFAAKGHEIAAVASAGAVVLDLVRWLLLRKSGLPLGGVLMGFQVADLTVLWKPPFWSLVAPWRGGAWGRGLFVPVLVAAMAISLAAGPSSAILVIPSLDWWDWPVPADAYLYDNVNSAETNFYINATEDRIWPAHITKTDFFPPACPTNATILREEEASAVCPSAGMARVVDWLRAPKNRMARGYKISVPMPANVGIDVFHRDIQLTKTHVELTAGAQEWALAETSREDLGYYLIAARSLLALKLGWNDVPGTKLSLDLADEKVPLVPQTFVACYADPVVLPDAAPTNKTLGNLIGDRNFEFPIRNSSRFASKWPAPEQLGSEPQGIVAAWLESPSWLDAASRPSIALAVVDARLVTDPGPGDSGTTIWTHACSVFAGWRDVSEPSHIVPGTDANLHAPDLDSTQGATLQQWAGPYQPQFDAEWNIVPANTNASINNNVSSLATHPIVIDPSYADAVFPGKTIFNTLWNTSETHITSPLSQYLDLTLASLMTDALARLGMQNSLLVTFREAATGVLSAMELVRITDVTVSVPLDPAQQLPLSPGSGSGAVLTQVFPHRARWGYSYSLFNGNVSRALAAAFLLAHAALALAHVLAVAVTGWLCEAYGEPLEMLAVAVGSRPNVEWSLNKNLFWALRRLRLADRRRTMWIDLLSIN